MNFFLTKISSTPRHESEVKYMDIRKLTFSFIGPDLSDLPEAACLWDVGLLLNLGHTISLTVLQRQMDVQKVTMRQTYTVSQQFLS